MLAASSSGDTRAGELSQAPHPVLRDLVLARVEGPHLPSHTVHDVEVALRPLRREVEVVGEREVDARVDLEACALGAVDDLAGEVDELRGDLLQQFHEQLLLFVAGGTKDLERGIGKDLGAGLLAVSDALPEHDALDAVLVLDEHDARVEHLLDGLH